MKILFIFLQIVTALPGNNQKQVNSVRNLPATVQTLVTAIQSDNFQAPSAFVLSKEQRPIKLANDNFRHLKETLGKVQSMASWDTLTYVREKAKQMDISIVLTTIDKSSKASNRRILMTFLVRGDRLSMQTSSTVSEEQWDLHAVKMIHRERHDDALRHAQYDSPSPPDSLRKEENKTEAKGLTRTGTEAHQDHEKTFAEQLLEPRCNIVPDSTNSSISTDMVYGYDHPNGDHYQLLYNKETRLLGINCPYTSTRIQPKYRFIQPLSRGRYFLALTKNGKLGYLDRRGKELF